MRRSVALLSSFAPSPLPKGRLMFGPRHDFGRPDRGILSALTAEPAPKPAFDTEAWVAAWMCHLTAHAPLPARPRKPPFFAGGRVIKGFEHFDGFVMLAGSQSPADDARYGKIPSVEECRRDLLRWLALEAEPQPAEARMADAQAGVAGQVELVHERGTAPQNFQPMQVGSLGDGVAHPSASVAEPRDQIIEAGGVQLHDRTDAAVTLDRRDLDAPPIGGQADGDA